LVVDPTAETREILRTALEQRGLLTMGASRAEYALAMAREHQPDLIVLDLEADASPGEHWTSEMARQSRLGDTPLVILGTARGRKSLGGEQFVAKPYHYGPLIRKIESLLEAAAQPLATSDQRTARSA
jgi:DNA-binding response OmpR family regulator